MMEMLKIYSIVLISIAGIFTILEIILSDEREERIKSFICLILNMPLLIYLILK